MPHLRLETNLPKSKIPLDFVVKGGEVIAKTLGKPVQLCVVTVMPDMVMGFGGSTEPCAIANLTSIGALGVTENKKHSKALAEFVKKELGVSSDRMYITYQDETAGNVGFKGTTFHELLSQSSIDEIVKPNN